MKSNILKLTDTQDEVKLLLKLTELPTDIKSNTLNEDPGPERADVLIPHAEEDPTLILLPTLTKCLTLKPEERFKKVNTLIELPILPELLTETLDPRTLEKAAIERETATEFLLLSARDKLLPILVKCLQDNEEPIEQKFKIDIEEPIGTSHTYDMSVLLTGQI